MQLQTFDEPIIEAIGQAIGDAFTHRQITDLFRRAGLDCCPDGAKWFRVRESLLDIQRRDRVGTNVARFVMEAMKPSNFVGRAEAYADLRTRLNEPLAFAGIQITEAGELRRVAAAATLSDAQKRADALRLALRQRGVHPAVLEFCRAELLVEDYFHAELEAAKSVLAKLRKLTEIDLDGNQLVDQALDLRSTDGPFLVFNSLRDDSDRNEHVGLQYIFKGLIMVSRNVPAHKPRIEVDVVDTDALDLFVLVSYLHRRLDSAQRTSRRPT